MQTCLAITEVSVNGNVLPGLGGIAGVPSGMFGVGGGGAEGVLITPRLLFVGIPQAHAFCVDMRARPGLH